MHTHHESHHLHHRHFHATSFASQEMAGGRGKGRGAKSQTLMGQWVLMVFSMLGERPGHQAKEQSCQVPWPVGSDIVCPWLV